MKYHGLLICITGGKSDVPYFMATLIFPVNASSNQIISPAVIPTLPT